MAAPASADASASRAISAGVMGRFAFCARDEKLPSKADVRKRDANRVPPEKQVSRLSGNKWVKDSKSPRLFVWRTADGAKALSFESPAQLLLRPGVETSACWNSPFLAVIFALATGPTSSTPVRGGSFDRRPFCQTNGFSSERLSMPRHRHRRVPDHSDDRQSSHQSPSEAARPTWPAPHPTVA